jgi:phage shock protein PspC (stress-responsive transcriptional regulator)
MPPREKPPARAMQLKGTVVWGLAGFYVVSARLVRKIWVFLQMAFGQLADLFDKQLLYN